MLKILCIAICAAAFFAQLSFSNPTSSEWTLMDQERDERPSSALGDRMRSDHLGMGDEEGPIGHMGRGVDRQLTDEIARMMSSDPLLSREWVDAMEWVQNKQQQQQQQQQHQRENEQQQQQMETRKRTGVSQFSPSFGKRMAFTPSFGKRYSWPSLFQSPISLRSSMGEEGSLRQRKEFYPSFGKRALVNYMDKQADPFPFMNQ
ncbi:uncharacterized protein LOC134853086 [Symsagittifera roscoffensis]|uniref:uncharacterized protein LOC134853086 n=1 Tax=Symsagittifera roscoffensis TaxID=84072 RepID=UPI00307C2555